MTVWGSVGMFVVYRPLLSKVDFSHGALKYVVCLCKGDDGCCVLCLYCDAWGCMCSCMGSMSVSLCICCMFVSCVHPMAVLNTAFCMTASRGCKRRPYGRGILQSRSHDRLIDSHESLLLFTHPVSLTFVVDCVIVLRCEWVCFM